MCILKIEIYAMYLIYVFYILLKYVLSFVTP